MTHAPAPRPTPAPEEQATGISNRETAKEEQAEREALPPVDVGPPPPQDAAGDVGDAEATGDGIQTSHKAGSRSVAQKEDDTRYPDRSMPPSRKVGGAFGKEPQG